MDEHHLYHPTYIKLLCLYSTEGCVQGRGDYTNNTEFQFFRKKSCRDPLHSCVDYAMLLNCTQVLGWSPWCCFVVFNQNKQQNPSCSPPVSFQWVGCILSSQVSSLLLLIYPEARTQAGHGIGFHRVMLRGCWARSTVLDWEHTELVQVHQGTENTQSVHSPCDFLFQEPGANMSIMGLLVPYPSYLSRDANKDNPEMDVYS